MVVMARWDAAECLRLIETERVTTAQMVPANFIRILEADWKSYDRSSVRKVLHAAAPCPVPVKRRIIEVFPPDTVWEYYGASEGMASVISPAEWLAKPGSVGRPFPGLTVRIVDEDGAELPPGEVGSIYVSAFAGQRFQYHNAPDKTESAWHGDYFTVGDMGWLDEDGYLFLADRRTDLIISGGVNIYPAEVEAALIEDDEVVDAAVIGLPDERMGQKVHAVVELRPGAAARRRGAPRPPGRSPGRLQAPPDRGVRRRAAARAQRQGPQDKTAGRAHEGDDDMTGAHDVKGEPRLLVDGKLVEASSGATFDNIDPTTEEVLGVTADGTADDMRSAIARGAPGLRRHRLVHRPRAAPSLPRAAARRGRRPHRGAARRHRGRGGQPHRPHLRQPGRPAHRGPGVLDRQAGALRVRAAGSPSATSSASPSAGWCGASRWGWWAPSRRGTSRST